MYDVLIIGAGITGCAAARELSKYNIKTVVIDKESDVACGTTKANSAIVHAGFDAEPGSLKAKLNVIGNSMFKVLSEELDFPFESTGALVLCFDENSIHKLLELKNQGEKNGVQGLKVVQKEELKAMEPNVSDEAVAALYAPTSGIVCPYEMTVALAENAMENGVQFSFDTRVINIKKAAEGYEVETDRGILKSKIVINAAGVYADEINNMISSRKLRIIPRKGEYMLFDKDAGNIVKRTIFQLPGPMGKGVLVTPTVDGNLLLGPNALDVEGKDDVNTTQDGLSDIKQKGLISIKNLPFRLVITSFAGIRAHEEGGDFVIGEAIDSRGFINAAGIESPGLSSAPAIALMLSEIVSEILRPSLNTGFKGKREGIKKFREMSNLERKEMIKERPEYGRIICRCELVTEGEIVDAVRRSLGTVSLDSVKRRTRAGMGRCQSGFCSTRVMEIISKEKSMSPFEITKAGGESFILKGHNKDSI